MFTDRRFRTLLFTTFAFAVASVASAQTTYHVNGTCGNDAWTGLGSVCQAPDGPKATIQAGLSLAFYGDTVRVANGLYTGLGNTNLGFPNGVVLRSQGGAKNCTINPAIRNKSPTDNGGSPRR